MEKLIIEIISENGDFISSLEQIKEQIENWFFSWFDDNDKGWYSFKIIES